MMLLSPVVLLLCRFALFVAGQGVESGGSHHGHHDDHRGSGFPGGSTMFSPTDPCMMVSPHCTSEADRYSLEALRNIHQMMDDDQDGGIEVEESVEFIIEDMKQQQTNKHSHLHREDQHITVEELWRGWKTSEVHNWTQDDVLRWLKDFVELPQYERNFKDFRVNGNTLPRIAAQEPSFLSGHLKVQDQRDKQKLSIKALDVVLFGPPTRPPHNYMKDLLLIVSVLMGIGGCWFAQAQSKASKIHITKMMKDLESLQTAELSLRELQEQLEQAQEEKRNVAEEKQYLEEKMRDEIMGAQEEAHRLHQLRRGAVSELSRLRYAEEELEQVRGALKQAEKDMQASWSATEALQLWLQLTHEVEVQYYNIKKHSAELQLSCAKEEAEKIKKKRSSMFGTFHVAHSSALDQVDHKILEAKNSLSEVTACLRERLHRWQQIERICGLYIIRNAGLTTLTAKLYSDPNALCFVRAAQPSYSCHSSDHGSMEDLFEDPGTPIIPQAPVPPLKRSPRTQASTSCRSRRSGVVTQPSISMISTDPDLLVPMRVPLPCFEEEEAMFIYSQKRKDSLEMFPDIDFMASASINRKLPSPSTIDLSSRKIYRDEMEVDSIESPVRKTSVEETEASTDVASRKMVRDKSIDSTDSSFTMLSMEETLMDTASKNIYADRSDLSLDVDRKMLRNELDTPVSLARRKISRSTMGGSMDTASRKMLRDEIEPPFDSLSRRMTRDPKGMSMDTVSRNFGWDKGELDSPMSVMPRDKVPASVLTRQLSRDEVEYSTDCLSRTMLPREKMEMLIDPSSRKVFREKQELGFEPAANRRILRDELDLPTTSLGARIPRDMGDSSIDTQISCDRVDIAMEIPMSRMLREDCAASESSSAAGRTGQPDLTMSSTEPRKISSELFSTGPLSQLVYDGILEKSCMSMVATPTGLSASTPNLPQSIMRAEVEQPLPLQTVANPSVNTSPSEDKAEKCKDKEKNKKSSKLKSLFKKKKDSATEKLQSGLQKL